MEKITVNTAMADVMRHPLLQPVQKYLIYAPDNDTDSPESQKRGMAPLQALSAIGWSPEGMAAGINCLLEAVSEGRMSQHFVYDEASCADDPYKKDVNLIRLMPEIPDFKKPFVILCAGGAYMSVCTMVEALPTARHFLALGFQVFILTYRVSVPEAAVKALSDLAEAVRFLGKHRDEFRIDPERYAVGGFSAGANLVSNWGCANVGYRRFGLPKPLCMFPVYTYIDLPALKGDDGGLLYPMFGEKTDEYLEEYNAAGQIDKDYPPCYIVCGKDDNTVPCRNSELMKEKLDACGVAAILEEGKHAQHGFGDGTGTDVEGWPERAAAFLLQLSGK